LVKSSFYIVDRYPFRELFKPPTAYIILFLNVKDVASHLSSFSEGTTSHLSMSTLYFPHYLRQTLFLSPPIKYI